VKTTQSRDDANLKPFLVDGFEALPRRR